MNSVLLSIRPQYCEMIASGKKTIEVRKTRPKMDTPLKCYIYCTSGAPYLNRHNGYLYLEERDTLGGRGHGIYDRLNRKVIGEFVCDRVERMRYPDDGLVDAVDAQMACLTAKEIITYSNGKPLYGWHISALQIYDKPRELGEFMKCKAPYDCCACDLWDEKYLTCGRKVRPPQSWCYVEEYDGKR